MCITPLGNNLTIYLTILRFLLHCNSVLSFLTNEPKNNIRKKKPGKKSFIIQYFIIIIKRGKQHKCFPEEMAN